MTIRAVLVSLAIGLTVSSIGYAQQWDWVQRFSGEAVRGSSVGTDDDQNVYLAGTFTGTNFIGTNRISSEAGHNIFIAKFSSFGEPLWVTTAAGALGKMLVASNGSVFVCGNLSFGEGASTITNVFLARLDGGEVAWIEPVPAGLSGASSMAFGPDESIYVLSSTTQAVVHRFTQGGELLNAFSVPGELLSARAIAVGPLEEIYILDRRRPSYNTIIDNISRVSTSGEVLWNWNTVVNDGFYSDQVQAIAATPDGGIVRVGYNADPLPQRSAIVAKHSMVGTQEWRTGVFSYFKRFHSAEAVMVDKRGNIHVTGYSHRSYYNAERLMVLGVSPTGEIFSAEHIESYLNGDRNAGDVIAVDKNGAVIVTGTLQGEPIFGTNRLGHAPLNGFVARRSTVLPELSREQIGNETVLTWPATALPFALQQSSDGGNTWSFVSVAPQRTGWVNHTTVPADTSTMFRLFRTNEAPVRHVPSIFRLVEFGGRFLDRPHIVISGIPEDWNARLRVYFHDEDLDPLTVTWTNLNTGQQLTNDIRFGKFSGRNDRTIRYPEYHDASVAIDSSMFPSGRYSVTVSVSDGTFTVTQAYPEFEVITYEQAVEEFLAALEPARSSAAGRKAIQLLEAYRRAQDRERVKLAEARWAHFKKQLGRVNSLTEEERGALASAAEVVKAVL